MVPAGAENREFKVLELQEVNGRDLSDVTAQEALDILQCMDEHITLEVLRKKPTPTPAPTETLDASTQTEVEWSKCPAMGKEELEVSSCERFLESLYQDFLLPEENSSDDEDYLPSMPHDVENAEELSCQDLGHTLYPEEDLESCYTDPGSIDASPSLTENEEDSEKTTGSPANLHDWDSGLGCTDGSLQIDDHSGHNTETEDLCVQAEETPDLGDGNRKVGSDSVDVSTSDDLSDSGFCSINPEEYLRFQKILEVKCRQYQLRESNRQGQRIRQSPGTQGEEGHGKFNDDVLDRSAWCPRLPTLEEYPEGTLTLPHLKSEESPTSICIEPCPTKITSRECEIIMQDKVNNQTQSTTASIPSGEDQATADRTLRRRSYLSCVQEDPLAEWLEYPVQSPTQSSWGDEGQCRDFYQKGKMLFEKGSVQSKKQNKSQLLKERALRLREERSGTTTDDDAQSEVKMGRHWSKAERRQHLLVAKEQKQRKELLLQSKMEGLTGVGRTGQDQGNRNDQNIIELSHKKLMRKRSKKVLDNWITIQELLSHGTKFMGGTTMYSPLLSVTTV